MVISSLLLLAGGMAAQHITATLPSDVIVATLVASIFALRWRRLRAPAWFVTGAALFLFAGTLVIDARLDPLYAGDSMLAEVRVADFPKLTDGNLMLLLETVGDTRIPPRVRASWYQAPVVPMFGEVWQLELRLKRPRGGANPGVFDYETWLFREKVHATGYVVQGKRNRLLRSGTASRVDEFRQRFTSRAISAADSKTAAGVLVAVGTGARHLVTREQWDRFAASGTSHLMAISGLHVGLAAMLAFALGFALAGLLPWRSNALVFGLLAGVALAAAYAMVSGLGVPARRAVIMLAAAALIVVRRRQLDAAGVIALAAVLVYVSDPVTSLAPGFHLSFGAVVLLVWLARRKDAAGRGAVIAGAMRRLFVLQVFLLLGLLPLTALLFQRFTPVATPVNLLAVPLFSFVTAPLTLAGLALGDVCEKGALVLLRLAALSIDALEAMIAAAVRLPLAHFHLADFSGAAVLLLCLPLLWVLLPPGWPGRRLAVLSVASIVLWQPPPPPAACFDSWVLDVGQGLAVAIQTREETFLYDTGMAWRKGGSAAEQTITPFLRSRGVRRIDRLIVSHADLDHSGGLAVLEREFDVGHVIVGEMGVSDDALQCAVGQNWWSGAIRFEVLHPADMQEGNDASCVLRVSAGPYALLLTGDIEAAAERALLRRRATLGAEVVLVPHHGSLTSSSVPFVDSVHAEVAIVSAAYANRWGFPKQAVVARWQASGAVILDTGTAGAVYLRICAAVGITELRGERQERRRFWHATS
ncbi:MAG: DNA internalization-related competence protein ComEC/Rec2 [Gammaproteobacteria bacterium]|nr:DNA internalization-related competence protein ComEC/Rec2 [Gammaproteobacteria bacterium]